MIALRSLLFTTFAGLALGHTWLEQLTVVKDGAYDGDFGYPRGYVSRTDPAFTGDSDNYLLPPLESGRIRIDETDLLCHPSQRSAEQSSEQFPRLKAAAGSYLALRYLENGHVTLPENQLGKPENGGTVLVFGTTEPKDDEKLADVLEWTADGSGGDKRGRLLTSQDFDDGRCYQINDSEISKNRKDSYASSHPEAAEQAEQEQWCETDVQLPEDIKGNDAYTLYWVWQWPTEAGVDPNVAEGKDEFYTTCSDIDITGKGKKADKEKRGENGNGIAAAERGYALEQQNPETAAVPEYKARASGNGGNNDNGNGNDNDNGNGNSGEEEGSEEEAPSEESPAPSETVSSPSDEAPAPSSSSVNEEQPAPTVTEPATPPSEDSSDLLSPGYTTVVTYVHTFVETLTIAPIAVPSPAPVPEQEQELEQPAKRSEFSNSRIHRHWGAFAAAAH